MSSSYMLEAILDFGNNNYSNIDIYFVKLDSDGTPIREQKYFLTDNELLPAPFELRITIKLQSYPEQPQNIKIKQTIEQDKCVICFEAKPNILYPDCGHVSTCEDCENKGDLPKCPLCRTKVIKHKYIIKS